MKKIIYALKTPFLLTVTFMIICGIGYPLLVTGLGQTLFPYQANGSQIKENGKVVGSALIGQAFTESTYLKGRPSGVNYNTYTAAEKENGHYLGGTEISFYLVIPCLVVVDLVHLVERNDQLGDAKSSCKEN